MSLLTIDFVKQNFPLWNKYCLDDEGAPDETILQNEMDIAEMKLGEFVEVNSETITDPIRLHLFNITRKRCFDRIQGDTVFEFVPQIVKEYDDTIALLTSYKNEEISPDGKNINASEKSIKLKAKKRRFKQWFNNDARSDFWNPFS